MNSDDKMKDMLSDYFRGLLTGDDALEVEAWITESREHRMIADEYCKVELLTGQVEAWRNVDVDKALGDVHKAIRRNRWASYVKAARSVAAAVVIGAFAFTSYVTYNYFMSSGEAMIDVTSTSGMMSCTTLPDGSVVWLNSNSKLSYPARFGGKERRVTLDGEAYFKVQKLSGKRFIVEAGPVDVEVTGTEFNVESYSKYSSEVRTTLASGHVNLSYTDHSGMVHEVKMNPGQQYTYDKASDKLTYAVVDPVTECSWKDGKLVLNHTQLPTVLRMLENRYNVRFLVKNEKCLENYYTGTFSDQRFEVILESLCRTTDIHFDFDANYYEKSLNDRQMIIVY
ncbi:MAG: FecR domain-containing protein [Bacteroidales bacterium]|nr:FecR domain-containing protein [Bacteroidales bacterium]